MVAASIRKIIEKMAILKEPMVAIALSLEFVLEALSIFCIAIGLFRIGQLAIAWRRRRSLASLYLDIRLGFGIWLLLALEFQLAADILSTTISPTFEALGKLAGITLIRTVLNYFLNKELTEEYEWRKANLKEIADLDL